MICIKRLLEKMVRHMGEKKSKEHDHIYKFQDIVDEGDDICKVYQCECGAKMIDRFIHTSTDFKDANK